MNDAKGLSEIVEKIVYFGQSDTSTCHFYSRVYSMLCNTYLYEEIRTPRNF